MVINTSETNLLNAERFFPRIIVGSNASASKGAVLISTTYIVESTGALYIEAFETGADVVTTAGALSLTFENTYQAQFQPSTTLSTTAISGSTIGFAAYKAETPFPVDTIVTIKLLAGVSTTSAVNYVLKVSERQSGNRP
ncbi:MAG: hypothetical protein QXL94_01160 [Candidatus Parvarchaeum sp.]